MSKDKTDRRLLDLVRIQLASRKGIKFGFNGFSLKEHFEFNDNPGDNS